MHQFLPEPLSDNGYHFRDIFCELLILQTYLHLRKQREADSTVVSNPRENLRLNILAN